ncbi:MAG: large conductance mechanosensitive channel protein MscL [Lachnospiraceae bacterium]|nr:large conductance mechanosensitive channel protein MscL [Lachnospiraceae bacterium]
MSLKKTVSEFKEFAVKGNVVDMAVGVIIGGAFGKIVASLVSDIIMPVISTLTNGIDFTKLFIAMDGNTYESMEAAAEAGVATINYGLFIAQVLDFVIIAFVIFLMIKQIAKFKKKEEAAPVAPTTKLCPFCKSEINIEATRCPNCTSELN